MTHISIIGGGIGGCCLALELKKLGISVNLFESRNITSSQEGLFLGITPNGLNLLKRNIDFEKLISKSTPGSMIFYNSKFKKIAELDNNYQIEKYGSKTIQVERSHLLNILYEEIKKKDISIFFNYKLRDLKQSSKNVTLLFENGSEVTTDFCIGSDGIFSKTRRILFPNAPKPKFTKIYSAGGYSKISKSEIFFGNIHMIFGEIGFFAFAPSYQGDIWWFNNFYSEEEIHKYEKNQNNHNEIISKLKDFHKNDSKVINTILQNTESYDIYPIYEYPKLEKWYSGNVCLIGDAAHATSPHIGQGASLALEDAFELSNLIAKYLAKEISLEYCFSTFQNQRKQRVEKIINNSRKIGNLKSKKNVISSYFRDRFLKYFIIMEIKKLDWIYKYSPEEINYFNIGSKGG